MQAARGTPVGPTTRLRLLFVGVALVAYAADQVSKLLAVAHLEGRPDDVRLVGDLLRLHLTFNSGAAFSTGEGLTPLITTVAIVATVVVLWFARRLGSTLWAVALGFLLAGITGNLTDRILREPGPLRGHVVDFLRLPNWPIFNIADICINIAAGLIIIQAIRGVRLDGTRDPDETGTSDPTDDAEGNVQADADVRADAEERAE